MKIAHSHLHQMEAAELKKKYCEYFGLQQTLTSRKNRAV